LKRYRVAFKEVNVVHWMRRANFCNDSEDPLGKQIPGYLTARSIETRPQRLAQDVRPQVHNIKDVHALIVEYGETGQQACPVNEVPKIHLY